jgi:hypothetical protein
VGIFYFHLFYDPCTSTEQHQSFLSFKFGRRDGSQPGLPDGISLNQNSHIGEILECLAMKDVSKFYVNSVYFNSHFVYILWPFGKFCGYFGRLYEEKSGNHDLN